MDKPMFSPLLMTASFVAATPSLASNVDLEVVTDSTIHACDACTLTQVHQVAQSFGNGRHYVYDLTNNAMHAVRVDCEPGAGGTISCLFIDGIVPSDLADTFNQYRSAWLGNVRSEAFTHTVQYQVPSGNPVGPDHLPQDNGWVNAYDTVVGGAYLLNLQNHLKNPSSYSGFMATLISVLNNSVYGDFSGLSLVITVYFQDGSRRKFSFNAQTMEMEPIPGTEIDAHNNPLPDSGLPPAGSQYYFTGPQDSAPYDRRNIIYLFPPINVPNPPGPTCELIRWNGEVLSCVLPN